MTSRFRLNVATCGWLICLSFTSVMTGAAAPEIPFSESGNDRVELSSGETLAAVVLRSDRQVTWLAVERSWLLEHRPALASQWTTDAKQLQATRQKDLSSRIDAWIASRPGNDELIDFLESEKTRIAADDGDGGKFFLKQIPRKQIRSIRRANDERRQLYLAAWVSGWDRVSELTVDTIKQRLQEKQLDPLSVQPEEFVALLPPKMESESSWRVRQALVESQYGPKLTFQGTADFWIPVDGQGQAVLENIGGGLAQQLFNNLLGGQRGEKGSALQRAIQLAKDRKVRGFQVMELQLNAQGIPQSVRLGFYAQSTNEKWPAVMQDREPVGRVQAGAIENLQANPQIQELMQLVKSLGLPIDGDQLQMALGAGAGVREAMQQITGRFVLKQQLYARSLDIPLWSDSQN